jgi:protocatechuate 4,5-dioxygenase beta chain
MLGLGIATSHAPALFSPAEYWPVVYDAIPDYMKESQPHTAKLETPAVIEAQIARIDKAFAAVRQAIAGYAPDAILYVGDDQGDMFNRSNVPAFAVFAGDEIWGATQPRYLAEPLEDSHIHVTVHSALAHFIHKELYHHDFEPALMEEMQPLGNPAQGMSHMLIHPHPRVVPNNDIPVIPLFINENFPPLPSARRCWELGVALREILDRVPEKVAIYASGGLSHDPRGPRAGWVDEPLDRWVLERIERGDDEALTNLFTFDSDTLRGGTGEIRAWITGAAAMGRPGTILDYFPSHHAKIGAGFVLWPPDDGA